MKKEFMIPKIEVISLSIEDIITTSSVGGGGANPEVPEETLGAGGGIGLPFDPFSYD